MLCKYIMELYPGFPKVFSAVLVGIALIKYDAFVPLYIIIQLSERGFLRMFIVIAVIQC